MESGISGDIGAHDPVVPAAGQNLWAEELLEATPLRLPPPHDRWLRSNGYPKDNK